MYLHTLGETLIKVGDREIRPTAPMLFAALLYLGMERGRRVPRTALQEMLFPNVDERSGAHSLRQLLYKLRQLGAPIEVDAATVMARAEDVLDESSSNGRAGEMEGALGFAGGFLPDYEPQISERFSEWVEHKRAFASAALRKKLVALIAGNREGLNWTAVEQNAQHLLTVDPYNEVATLALAEAAALSGGKAAAIRILAKYEQETGRKDINVPAALLKRRISESIPEHAGRPPSLPFVGREVEARELRKHVSLARHGKPSLVVIGGEPGIGKSRLLEETASLAALEGMKAHVVRCQSHYASRPLSVFIELVPALRSCRGALGVSPESLARLNLLTSHTDDRADRPTDARDDVTRSELVLAAIRDLIDAVTSEGPLLIAVEDAHWADADSLRELSRAVHGATAFSLLVICTTRLPDAFPRAPGLEDRITTRRLKPLLVKPMSALALHLLPKGTTAIHTEIADWCVKTAAGNPLFLQMLCAHYSNTGEAFAVPPDMLSAITRRLEQLPQQCRRILEFSALLGRHCTIASLRSVTDSSDAQLLEAVRRLEEEGYLQDAGDAIRISHDLLSETALHLVPPITRRVLHSCVASELEKRYDVTQEAALLWDCSDQWHLAGDIDKARTFVRRCARHATHIGRASDALDLLERAKQLSSNGQQISDLLMEMALVAKAAGRWDTVQEVCLNIDRLANTTRNAPVAVDHGELELVSVEAGWFARGDAKYVIPRALRCLNTVSASVEHRTWAARILLVIAHELCDTDLANRVYDTSAPFLDDESGTFDNRFIPLFYHSVFGDREQALHLGRRLTADLERFDISPRMRAASNTIVAFSFIGALDEARILTEEYSKIAEALGLTAWVHTLSSQFCSALITLEDFGRAQQWFELAQATKPSEIRGIYSSVHLSNYAELALARDDVAAATDSLEALRSLGGDILRLKAYLRGLEVRINQKDAKFLLDESDLNTLIVLCEGTKRFACADGLVSAIGEDLRRRGRTTAVHTILAEYLGVSRREKSAAPPSFVALLQHCSSIVAA